MSTKRERIGSEIAYGPLPERLGWRTVMRCGGTIEVEDSDGDWFRIEVSELGILVLQAMVLNGSAGPRRVVVRHGDDELELSSLTQDPDRGVLILVARKP